MRGGFLFAVAIANKSDHVCNNVCNSEHELPITIAIGNGKMKTLDSQMLANPAFVRRSRDLNPGTGYPVYSLSRGSQGKAGSGADRECM